MPEETQVGVSFFRNAKDGKDYVKILVPGDDKFEPVYKADPFYQAKYPEQWDRYKRGIDELEGQTLLEEVAWMDEADRNNLRGLKIRSIEQLAAVSDAMLPNIGIGARVLRDRAKTLVDERVELERLRQAMAATAQVKTRKAASV